MLCLCHIWRNLPWEWRSLLEFLRCLVVGEAGPEAVLPLGRAGGLPALNLAINFGAGSGFARRCTPRKPRIQKQCCFEFAETIARAKCNGQSKPSTAEAPLVLTNSPLRLRCKRGDLAAGQFSFKAIFGSCLALAHRNSAEP